MRKRTEQIMIPHQLLDPSLDQKSNKFRLKKVINKTITKKQGIGYQKGSQKRAEINAKSHQKNDAKTCNGKDKEHHQKSCFSEW